MPRPSPSSLVAAVVATLATAAGVILVRRRKVTSAEDATRTAAAPDPLPESPGTAEAETAPMETESAADTEPSADPAPTNDTTPAPPKRKRRAKAA